MKRGVGVFFLFLAALALPSFGDPSAARDLGEGLFYLRVTAESDLGAEALTSPTAPSVEAALILDLRYVETGTASALRLSEWLSGHADMSPETSPVFFLVNAETGAALCEAVFQFSQNYPSLVIGPADIRDFRPDILLTIDPEEERAAYAALGSGGADIAALMGEGVVADKRRYDEAAAIAAHAAPEADDELRETGRRSRRSRSGAATDSENTKATGKAALARPVDLALQRAIHLYRAWRVFDQQPQP